MEDIIIFGIGKKGERAVHKLKDRYHILFMTDNDEEKWGDFYYGYAVKPPVEILSYDSAVVITPNQYRMDILYQLLEMGVNQSRIYFFDTILVNHILEYELYPLDSQKVENTGKELVEYDLLRNREAEHSQKKILVCCGCCSVYTKQLVENIYKRYDDIEFSLLTAAKENRDEIDIQCLKHIYYFQTISDIKTILEQLPMYDAIQLLWIERRWSYFYKLIRSKTKRLNLNVGGSEFYREGEAERNFKKNLILSADKVTAEIKGTVKDFLEYYYDEVKDKMGLIPFGIEVLDWIKSNQNLDKKKIKEKFNIPTNKIVVTCGHNANEAHQHMDIIEALCCLENEKRRQIVCVFPMTYNGSAAYVRKVSERLDQTDIEHVILTEFMDFQSMAEYALISDIMIHVQTTDQLSSTMLEEMYAGSIVIAGSWLPYRSLHDMGIYFLDVDTIPEVTTVLGDVVANIENYKEKCRGNSEIVWNHSSWDVLAPKWRALWD